MGGHILIKFLIKKFIKDSEKVNDKNVRESLFVNKFVTYLCTLFMNYFLGLIGWI